MNLEGFLKQNAMHNENIKYVASNRFVDEKGDPIQWEIKAISSKEDEQIRNSATKKVQVPNKKGQYTQELDANKYIGLLASYCTVYPNLNDAKLQDSYSTMSADELLKAMLLPGEYADYLLKVQDICGFDKSQSDLVEEAKN